MKDVQDMLVLKVGTSTLAKDGRLDRASFDRIGEQVDRLRRAGSGVLLVSSGARKLGWNKVIQTWNDAIGDGAPDFLLTEKELDVHDGCDKLLAVACAGGIAIANANDGLLHTKSRYRSNDCVGARLARHALDAGLNVQGYGMLSDVAGVYDNAGTHLAVVDVEEHRHVAGGAGSETGTGGMLDKFIAAGETVAAGIETWVAHGRTDDAIALAMAGEIGTRFIVAGR